MGLVISTMKIGNRIFNFIINAIKKIDRKILISFLLGLAVSSYFSYKSVSHLDKTTRTLLQQTTKATQQITNTTEALNLAMQKTTLKSRCTSSTKGE